MNTVSATAAPTSVCPQCGAQFRCGMEAGDQECWCASLPPLLPLLPLPAQSDPGSPAASCLCPACLKERMSTAAAT
ncbi:MAG: cysteine-rich CWC family protein [Sulfuritalea sp.]|nr:cysteine-rich CWC family protein [Sulfuritalea sp.]